MTQRLVALVALALVGLDAAAAAPILHHGPGWELVRFTSDGEITLTITLSASTGGVLSAYFFGPDASSRGVLVAHASSGGYYVRAEHPAGAHVAYEADGGGGNVQATSGRDLSAGWLAIYAAGGVGTWSYAIGPTAQHEVISSGARTLYSDGPEFVGGTALEMSAGRQTRYASGAHTSFEIDGFFVGEVGGGVPGRLTHGETIAFSGPTFEANCPCYTSSLTSWPAGDYVVTWDGLSHSRSRYIVLSGADISVPDEP